jgi:hypothetical protein
MTDRGFLIPDAWTVPLVALNLRCDHNEARVFVAEHQNDPDGLLVAVEREALRRDLAWLDSIRDLPGRTRRRKARCS